MGTSDLRDAFTAAAPGFNCTSATLDYERAHDTEWQVLTFRGTDSAGEEFEVRADPVPPSGDIMEATAATAQRAVDQAAKAATAKAEQVAADAATAARDAENERVAAAERGVAAEKAGAAAAAAAAEKEAAAKRDEDALFADAEAMAAAIETARAEATEAAKALPPDLKAMDQSALESLNTAIAEEIKRRADVIALDAQQEDPAPADATAAVADPAPKGDPAP